MRPAALAFLLILIGAAPGAQRSPEPFVPVGVWYGGGALRPPMTSHTPASERTAWRRDLDRIRALGFNSIRTWVDWASAEPQRGAYRFDALDQILALADETGLKVILQLFTDRAPEWLGQRYPDASFVTDRGVRIGSQGSPGYCLDHAGVRADQRAFLDAVSARAAVHPSLHAVDVWSEPHVVNRVWFDTPVEFCYCPHTQRRFREWLQAKYGSLDALNGAWSRGFGSWDEPEAPRYGTSVSHADLIDWKTFIAVKLQEDLEFKARASASRGPRPVGSHSDAPAVLLSPRSGYGDPDDWWMTRSVDHYGTSIYPKPAMEAPPWSPVRLAAALDGIRSAAGAKGWWLGELQAGQSVSGVDVGPPVTASDLRLWSWAGLSRGARAVSYYAWVPVSSGRESSGYGMIDFDGTVTDRARAAGQFAGLVSRNPRLFEPLRPRPSRVAILFNPLAGLAGGDTASSGRAVRRAMAGFYRAMFERNIQTDFVHSDEILAGRAMAYAVVFLAYPLVLQEAVAHALKLYVHAGGTVVSEARPAWTDERGRAGVRTPGFGLDEMFGAREKLVRSAERVEMIGAADLDGPLAPLAGAVIAGSGVAEHLEIVGLDTRVLARFPGDTGAPGDPAIVMSRHGSGRAILLGSFPAAAFDADPDAARSTGDLLGGLVALAGVTPEVRIDRAPGLVEARFLESSAAMLLIAINHDDRPQKVTMTFSPEIPEAIWQNMETGTSVNFVAGPGGPTYTHAFAARDVLVLMIKKDLR